LTFGDRKAENEEVNVQPAQDYDSLANISQLSNSINNDQEDKALKPPSSPVV